MKCTFAIWHVRLALRHRAPTCPPPGQWQQAPHTPLSPHLSRVRERVAWSLDHMEAAQDGPALGTFWRSQTNGLHAPYRSLSSRAGDACLWVPASSLWVATWQGQAGYAGVNRGRHSHAGSPGNSGCSWGSLGAAKEGVRVQRSPQGCLDQRVHGRSHSHAQCVTQTHPLHSEPAASWALPHGMSQEHLQLLGRIQEES